MEELIKQFGVLSKFVDIEVMLAIFILIEFVKKIISILKNLFKFKLEIPSDGYPVLSIFLGAVFSFIRPFGVSLIVGICSGIGLTVSYSYFEKISDKIGGKNGSTKTG